MGYNTATGRASYTATGGLIFGFVFKIYNPSDLKVYSTPMGSVTSDVDNLLVLNVDYTVAVSGDNGGTVTMTTPPSVGSTIVLVRELPIQREFDYQQGGDLDENVLDEDQNYQTYLVADRAENTSRFIRVPDSAVNVNTVLPNVNSNSYLRWNADGTALENDTTIPDAVVTSTDNAAAALLSEENAKASEDAALVSEQNVYAAADEFVNTTVPDATNTFNSNAVDKTNAYNANHVDKLNIVTAEADRAEDEADRAEAAASSVDDSNLVHRVGNESVAGIKNFSSSPIVPTPTSTTHAANKSYVDNKIAAINNTDVYVGAYGVKWNNLNDTYVRTGANGYTAIQSLMRRCVLNTNGDVNYYLGATDSTKKEDMVTASDLTGASGNVMVQIPKFYVKYSNTDGAKEVSISLTADDGYTVHPAFIKAGVQVDYRYYRAYKGYVTGGKLISRSGVTPTRSQTIATFRGQATANGTGWHLNDWNLLAAIQTLLFVEIASFDSQSAFGNGNDTGADYGITTGQSNGIGNNSSSAYNDNTWMSYRGIENFYADCWEFIDGVNFQNRLVYTNGNYTTFASDVFTGAYTSTGVTLPTASGDYIKDLNISTKGFIPITVGGSSATYVTDGCWSATGNTILLFGGGASNGLIVGAWCFSAYDASSVSDVSIGAGVSF